MYEQIKKVAGSNSGGPDGCIPDGMRQLRADGRKQLTHR